MKVINKLNVPESWNEVSFGTYQLLSGLNLEEANSSSDVLDNSIRITATLLGTSKSIIGDMSRNDFIKIQNTIKFISTSPPKTTRVKWKFIPLQKVSMDKWMAYDKYIKNAEENLVKIMILMLEDEVTEADIKSMAVTEVLSGFFTLERKCNQSIRRSRRSFLLKLMKLHLKAILTEILKKMGLKKRK